jgi:RsmE family RNA methyltransferase
MNIILFKEEELKDGIVCMDDNRAKHLRKVLKVSEGDNVRLGLLNGKTGTGEVVSLSDKEVCLKPFLDTEPPKPANLSLVIALPRPKVFRRILFCMVSAGVKDIHIINSWRVEKSYWDSPYISSESIEKISLEALQQSKDTIMPKVTFHRFFMDFMDGELAEMPKHRFLAHPYNAEEFYPETPAVIAIGPEGGFVQREVDTFLRYGFKTFSLGERILTTEHSVPFILGKFI